MRENSKQQSKSSRACRGAISFEYILLIALVFFACIPVFQAFKSSLVRPVSSFVCSVGGGTMGLQGLAPQGNRGRGGAGPGESTSFPETYSDAVKMAESLGCQFPRPEATEITEED